MNQFKKTAFITLCVLVMPFAFGGNAWVFADTSDLGTSNGDTSDLRTSNGDTSDLGTSNSGTSAIGIPDIGVYIDGTQVDFPDTKPYISNSRTLVPARFVVEQLGASIDWDNDTGTVSISKDEDSITLVIGSAEMVRNGVPSTMDVAPVITDSRTMVPLRFVSEQLGVLVEWDIEKNSAILTTEKPELSILTPEVGGQPVTTEAIDFITTYERTDTLYRGESQIISDGAAGTLILVGTKTPAVIRGEGKEISVGCSADEMIAYAKEYLGVPYRYNGTTPDGFDCSGFTQYVVAHFGGILPHSSGGQYYYGISVEREELEPGDLVFFEAYDNPMKIGHVGIYIGNGEFIHSPQAGETVKITNLTNVYFDPRFYGAIRMDNEESL